MQIGMNLTAKLERNNEGGTGIVAQLSRQKSKIFIMN